MQTTRGGHTRDLLCLSADGCIDGGLWDPMSTQVLTLGCKCWPTVRDAYITLCHDLDAKVRRTLAYSIHEVAQMLPVEDVMQDLVPLFNLFLKVRASFERY